MWLATRAGSEVKRLIVGALAGCLLLAAGCAPAPIPPVANAPLAPISLDDLPTPLPLPYDSSQTAEQITASLDAAFARAKAEDKRVIVDLGGNWCSWCRILSGIMELPEVAPFIEANFVVVPVEVSSQNWALDRNLEALSRFDIDAVDAFPWLIIAEPDGTVLNASSDVTAEDHETPQGVVNWLAQWAKHPATR